MVTINHTSTCARVSGDWLLVWTEPGREAVATQYLTASWNRCVVYFPQLLQRVVRNHRLLSISRPLFPRYLFVRNDGRQSFRTLRSTPGVSGLVMVADRPATVGDAVVADVARRLRELNEDPSSSGPFKRGVRTSVSVADASLDAIFIAADGGDRARLLIQMLGASRVVSAPLISLEQP